MSPERRPAPAEAEAEPTVIRGTDNHTIAPPIIPTRNTNKTSDTKTVALELYRRGWHPIPLPAGRKGPPGEGLTGGAGVDLTNDDIDTRQWAGNIATRMPAGVLGVDVDNYNGGDVGLAELETRYGTLPPTWRTTSRTDGSGIGFYRVPVDTAVAPNPAAGVDMIQRHHRYAVVAPSYHPDGRPYRWIDPNGEPVDTPPEIDELPALPFAWIDGLATVRTSTAPAVTNSEVVNFCRAHQRADEPYALETLVDQLAATKPGGRHDTLVQVAAQALRGARAGLFSGAAVIESLEAVWNQITSPDDRTDEYRDVIRWAVAQVNTATDGDIDHTASQLAPVDLAELAGTTNEPEPKPDTGTTPARDGAAFLLDELAELEARWGERSDVLWARGESLLLVGPPGVGKTTLAGQLLAALIGSRQDVLGLPVMQARRVLYLAMDRPRQVRRALRRLFTETDRQNLADRLVVLPGPIPADLGREPATLIGLAKTHDCDVIVVDSLKDAAVKLSDDEAGGNVNRAIQACNAHDVDVLVLHHQRKGQHGEKPTGLADVYGSTWITSGAGSVILLWGDAGSELVELTHLKQPADTVGPWTVEHNHHDGTSTIAKGFDALAYLRARPQGVTVAEAAQAEHGKIVKAGGAQWKRTERRLRALVRDGFAEVEGQTAVGVPARYRPVGTLDSVSGSVVDTAVDTPVEGQ